MPHSSKQNGTLRFSLFEKSFIIGIRFGIYWLCCVILQDSIIQQISLMKQCFTSINFKKNQNGFLLKIIESTVPICKKLKSHRVISFFQVSERLKSHLNFWTARAESKTGQRQPFQFQFLFQRNVNLKMDFTTLRIFFRYKFSQDKNLNIYLFLRRVSAIHLKVKRMWLPNCLLLQLMNKEKLVFLRFTFQFFQSGCWHKIKSLKFFKILKCTY
eukprot:TRINITY_DN3101_c0_g1_i1.p1 TRINITY_DN3101_c0_g1~~TRINITY_DN3101_c0_g1_i1.p1  ORF type:complete len:214 (+),score=-21.20 TRINITY_DN3101_c0_g1_i1:413-1054(+)